MRRGLRRTHGAAAWAMAAAVIAILVAGLALRQDRGAAPEPVRLEPPTAQ